MEKGDSNSEVATILGVYFSGTGNTKHCVEEFLKLCDENNRAISIEDSSVLEQIDKYDTIVLGYPVYFSNVPKIMRDFICENGECFRGKQVFLIATMGLFSGDGTGCVARILKKYNVKILGGLHLKMPDNIGDEKALKRSKEANMELIRSADEKIAIAVQRFKEGKPMKEGLNFFYHLAGLLGQRLWFYGKTATYKQKPNVDKEKCNGCGTCVAICPMKNMGLIARKVRPSNKCTLCYRCVSSCPTGALTILGNKIHEQYLFEKIITENDDNDSDIRFEIINADFGPEDLEEQLPIRITVLRQLPGPDTPNYWLVKCDRPLNWKERDCDINYLIVGCRFEGTKMEKGASMLALNVAYVTDESILNDERTSFDKCAYVAICVANGVERI